MVYIINKSNEIPKILNIPTQVKENTLADGQPTQSFRKYDNYYPGRPSVEAAREASGWPRDRWGIDIKENLTHRNVETISLKVSEYLDHELSRKIQRDIKQAWDDFWLSEKGYRPTCDCDTCIIHKKPWIQYQCIMRPW